MHAHFVDSVWLLGVHGVPRVLWGGNIGSSRGVCGEARGPEMTSSAPRWLQWHPKTATLMVSKCPWTVMVVPCHEMVRTVVMLGRTPCLRTEVTRSATLDGAVPTECSGKPSLSSAVTL